MNYATIKPRDIANGPGVRVSLFVSGCTHHCPECFNQEAWDFAFGQPFTPATEEELLRQAAPDFVAGLSLLGGEPFEPANQAALLPFVTHFRQTYPQKTVWCYSGYTLEELTGASRAHTTNTLPLLQQLNVLVDGEFVAAKKNLRLVFRGSENQRVLDVPASLAAGRAVWLAGFAQEVQ